MTEQTSEPSASRTGADGTDPSVPLVLHVIPTRTARGAQREARALADQLDAPGLRRHRVLNLFAGPSEVHAELSLDHPGGDDPAVGFDPRLVATLRRSLAHLDPAVLVAHGSESLKYLVPATLGRRRPLAYYAIGTYSGSGRRVQEGIWRRLVRRPDAVVAEGEEVAEECIRRFGVPAARVIFVPNGRDPERFRPVERPHRSTAPLMTFVGALTSGKRPDRFLEVADALRGRGIDFRAELIGDGPLRDRLAGPARSADVEMPGLCQDVPERLRTADVFVFPSRPAGEGMPGVLIEAGLSGLPVVATAVPGVASIIRDGETGFVVPVEDLGAMVNAAGRLLGDQSLRTAMGRAAREHCLANFSLDAVGRRWLGVLEPLLADGSIARRSRRR